MTLAGVVALAFIVAYFSAFVYGFRALADILRHTEAEWAAIGQSRPMWIVLVVAGVLLGGIIGLFYAVFYLVRVRPKLEAVATT